MKILLLNYEFPPLGGGASPVSYEMARKYIDLGHQVDVVTMGFKSLASFEVKDGINIYRLKCLRSKKEICHPHEQLSYILAAKKFFKQYLKTNKYSICHAHFVIPTGIISLWLKKRYKIPYIITSHGSDIPGYNPDRFKFLHKFTKPLIVSVINNSAGAYAGSQYLVDLANKLNFKNKYKLIRHGFDSDKFKPVSKKNIILYTGRFLKRKGLKYLIKAVSDKNIGYELHILGDGPAMLELKNLAKESKTKTIFHGWLDNNSQDYKDLLESAKIYVLVSERENSSVSLLEAMSAGCAIITSNVSGCPEVVGEAGVLIPPKDVKALRFAINSLIGNEKHYGELARKRLLDFFSWDKSMSEYIEVIKKI